MSSASIPSSAASSAAKLVALGRKFQTPQYSIETFTRSPFAPSVDASVGRPAAAREPPYPAVPSKRVSSSRYSTTQSLPDSFAQ